MDAFWTLPPVTRTIVAASLVTSIGVYSGLVPFAPLVFLPYRIFKFPPEIWRVITSFFITGPQLGILMDPYFLYQYGSQLETGSARFSDPGSFFVYIVFVGAVIMGLAGYVLGAFKFLDALIMAITYTFAQENANRMVTFFVITIQAKYLPYLLVLSTFVMGGTGAALHQATGLFAAHLYDFLTHIWPTYGGGRNFIKTPGFVRDWFAGSGVRPTPQTRGYGTSFAAPTEGRSTATSWTGSRGPGRRLGGD